MADVLVQVSHERIGRRSPKTCWPEVESGPGRDQVRADAGRLGEALRVQPDQIAMRKDQFACPCSEYIRAGITLRDRRSDGLCNLAEAHLLALRSLNRGPANGAR